MINNPAGSLQGQTGAVIHFLLRLPWKLACYDIVCVCPAPAAIVLGLVLLCVCVCLMHLSDHKGGLWRRENRRLVLPLRRTHTGLWECQAVGWLRAKWITHTKSHTAKPTVVQTHICRTDCTCQSVAGERDIILNDGERWHRLGWWAWINIQILCKNTLTSIFSISAPRWTREFSGSDTNWPDALAAPLNIHKFPISRFGEQ